MGMDRLLERLSKEGPGFRVSELADLIGCSRSYLHKCIAAGTIEVGRIGRVYVIPIQEAAKVAKAAGRLRE